MSLTSSFMSMLGTTQCALRLSLRWTLLNTIQTPVTMKPMHARTKMMTPAAIEPGVPAWIRSASTCADHVSWGDSVHIGGAMIRHGAQGHMNIGYAWMEAQHRTTATQLMRSRPTHATTAIAVPQACGGLESMQLCRRNCEPVPGLVLMCVAMLTG